MKLKSIQPFLIAYIILSLVKFEVKEFDQDQYPSFKPVFTGLTIATVAACLIYYAWIFVVAWLRNRKEELADQRGVE
jgi:uncharacterized protein (DUF2062 family)